MKRLLLGVFAIALVALVFGFAASSDSHQAPQNADANAIVMNTTNSVAATDTDVGPATTAIDTSALINNTALDLTTTSLAVDPGGGANVSASFGSTYDILATTTRAGPPTTLAVLDGTSTNTYVTTASRASPSAFVDGILTNYATAIALITSVLVLAIVTAIILRTSQRGDKTHGTRRGHAQITGSSRNGAAVNVTANRSILAGT